jgi:hypothetical protein
MINLNAHKIHIQNTHLKFEEKKKPKPKPNKKEKRKETKK